MEPPGASPRMILVGRIMRSIGLRGEVVIDPTGDEPKRFAKGARLHTQSDPPRELTVRSSRPYGNRFAVAFEGIDSVEGTGELRGLWLEVPIEALPPLPEGVYYHFQVIGLTVVDADGAVLGRIESIIEAGGPAGAGGNDVYCVGRGEQEILIPAVRDFIGKIDLESGRLLLKVPRSALGLDDPPV